MPEPGLENNLPAEIPGEKVLEEGSAGRGLCSASFPGSLPWIAREPESWIIGAATTNMKRIGNMGLCLCILIMVSIRTERERERE